MKIEATAEEFKAALNGVLKPKSNPAVPVLGYAKVGIDGLTTTNLDITTTAIIHNAQGEGEFLIPYRQVADLLKGEHGPLVIESDQSTEPMPALDKDGEPADLPKPKIVLTIGGAEFKFDSLDVRRFPEIPAAAPFTLTVFEKDFQKLLNRVTFAVSTEDSRYTLGGALFGAKDGNLTAVATDGHRLSKAFVYADGALDRTIVRLDALKWLHGRKGDVQIGADENYQVFRIGSVTMITRKCSGQFPNWEAVMPLAKSETVHVLITDPAALLTVLKRVAKVADKRSGATTWSFGRGKSTVSATSMELGTASATIPVSASGDIVIGWNAEFVEEFLKLAGDEPWTLEIKDAQSAVLFSNGYDFDYVLMPMRI